MGKKNEFRKVAFQVWKVNLVPHIGTSSPGATQEAQQVAKGTEGVKEVTVKRGTRSEQEEPEAQLVGGGETFLVPAAKHAKHVVFPLKPLSA